MDGLIRRRTSGGGKRNSDHTGYGSSPLLSGPMTARLAVTQEFDRLHDQQASDSDRRSQTNWRTAVRFDARQERPGRPEDAIPSLGGSTATWGSVSGHRSSTASSVLSFTRFNGVCRATQAALAAWAPVTRPSISSRRASKNEAAPEAKQRLLRLDGTGLTGRRMDLRLREL